MAQIYPILEVIMHFEEVIVFLHSQQRKKEAGQSDNHAVYGCKVKLIITEAKYH